jgi:streptogramin lyase
VRIDNPSPREGPAPNLSCDGTLAVGTRWLWLSDICERTVTRLDPRTGVTTAIDVGGEPWTIALVAGAAWVSTGLGLQRIAVDSAEATLVSPQNNSLATYSDGRVWFLDCWGCERASLRTIDASDGSEIKPRIRVSP